MLAIPAQACQQGHVIRLTNLAPVSRFFATPASAHSVVVILTIQGNSIMLDVSDSSE